MKGNAMTTTTRKLCLVLAMVAFFSSEGRPEEPAILQKVADLQKTAYAANQGVLGCGDGTIRLLTSKGEVDFTSGLDAIQVFGNPIKTSDLFALLKSRSESNRSGKPGPMSGDVTDLCFVCLSTLSCSKDTESIPVVADLLTDKEDAIRGWAAIALYRLGRSSEDLLKKVSAIQFPKMAVESATARGEQPPSWVVKAK
jgi:hypothetical protein